MNQVPVIQVVGYKKSGKTTLLCSIVQQLRTRGVRVAVIKHDAHEFAIDRADTDTWKLRQAGAGSTLITSTNQTAIMHQQGTSLEDCIQTLENQALDVILVEGFKNASYPKIVCLRTEADLELLSLANVRGCAWFEPNALQIPSAQSLCALPISDGAAWAAVLEAWMQERQAQPNPGIPLFAVGENVIDAEALRRRVEHDAAGAVVLFCGAVREWTKGKRTLRLFYEAYVPMAVKQLEVIATEIAQQWPGVITAIHHRIGELAIGDYAVVIATSSVHRKDAYLANEYAIERIKQIVPIWKKEFWEDGTAWIGDQLEQQAYPQGQPDIKND